MSDLDRTRFLLNNSYGDVHACARNESVYRAIISLLKRRKKLMHFAIESIVFLLQEFGQIVMKLEANSTTKDKNIQCMANPDFQTFYKLRLFMPG